MYTGGTGSLHLSDSRVSGAEAVSSIVHVGYATPPDYGSSTVENVILTGNSANTRGLLYSFTANGSYVNTTAIGNFDSCGVRIPSLASWGHALVRHAYFEGGAECSDDVVSVSGQFGARVSVTDVLIKSCTGDTMGGVRLSWGVVGAYARDVTVVDSVGESVAVTCYRGNCFVSNVHVVDCSVSLGAFVTESLGVLSATHIAVRGLTGSAVYVHSGGPAVIANSTVSQCR